MSQSKCDSVPCCWILSIVVIIRFKNVMSALMIINILEINCNPGEFKRYTRVRESYIIWTRFYPVGLLLVAFARSKLFFSSTSSPQIPNGIRIIIFFSSSMPMLCVGSPSIEICVAVLIFSLYSQSSFGFDSTKNHLVIAAGLIKTDQ